ncbi:IS200/IS605 family transposase [Sulfobacillus thermosulfidooxidans]|uniref:IS200/IS605 family transposase n=1 Tax=Sulfobacillus thermosulfidooxidans TaxID=28034 RepID=UPI00036B53F8|nr:IS200/IS605 family transposase [Sulfobacillus thermosulfidooxidans]
MMSASHAVYSLRLHIVFVTKYRRKTLTSELLAALREAFAEILNDWRCTLIEFGGEADHVHLLVGIHPALNLSTLINNLKSASARQMRNRFADHLAKFYWKPYFWHRAYYVGSVGEASLETVKRYVEAQGTQENPARRPRGRRPLDPLLAIA